MIYARWALFAGALGVIGAFGATLLNYPADPRVISVARRSSIALGAGALLTIGAQLYAWFGIEGFTDPANVGTMLSITLWGLHWTWLALTTIGVIVVLSFAARRPAAWIYVNGAAALAVAAVVPLIGHGGTHDALTTFLHRAHILGAGVWVGSLAVTLLAGIADRPRLLLSLRRFAPIAFTGAGVVAASGFVLAWEHLRPFSVLWTTDYGLVLIAKVVSALIVGALGFVNWRQPRLRVVIAEVAIAFVVVLTVTAVLSGLEPPSAGH